MYREPSHRVRQPTLPDSSMQNRRVPPPRALAGRHVNGIAIAALFTAVNHEVVAVPLDVIPRHTPPVRIAKRWAGIVASQSCAVTDLARTDNFGFGAFHGILQ